MSWVVEGQTFLESLMDDKMIMLNKNGINQVVEIIKDKDKEIERLNNIINELKEFLIAYENNRDSFKWNEQDYIDTIEEIEKIIGYENDFIKELKGSDK